MKHHFVINDEQKPSLRPRVTAAHSRSNPAEPSMFVIRGSVRLPGQPTDNGSIASGDVVAARQQRCYRARHRLTTAADDSFVWSSPGSAYRGSDIKGVRVDFQRPRRAGVPGLAEHGDEGQNGDVALLPNCNYVSVFREGQPARERHRAGHLHPDGTLIRGPQSPHRETQRSSLAMATSYDLGIGNDNSTRNPPRPGHGHHLRLARAETARPNRARGLA